MCVLHLCTVFVVLFVKCRVPNLVAKKETKQNHATKMPCTKLEVGYENAAECNGEREEETEELYNCPACACVN